MKHLNKKNIVGSGGIIGTIFFVSTWVSDAKVAEVRAESNGRILVVEERVDGIKETLKDIKETVNRIDQRVYRMQREKRTPAR